MNRYEFGYARGLYAANIHPRVALGPADLADIRLAVKRGAARKVMKAMRHKVGVLTDLILEANDLPALLKGDHTWHSPAARIRGSIDDFAMVAAVDEDARTIDAVTRVMDGKLQFVHGRLIQAYDLISPYLTEKCRREFVVAAREQIETFLDMTASTHFRNAGGNVTLGHTLEPLLIMLSIAGDPGAGDVRKHQEYLVNALEASVNVAINRDGYPEEDIGYGSDVAGWLVYLAEVTCRAGLVDLFERCPRLLKTCYWAGTSAVSLEEIHHRQSFDLDFHSVPYYGEDPVVERFYVSARSRRQPSVLVFLAQDADSRAFCGACHSMGEVEGSRIPQVALGSHGNGYLCWQCHYPHYPETGGQ